MYKNVVNYFFPNKEEKAEDRLASISIEVNPDGTLNICCDWPEFDNKNSQNLKDVSYYYALAIHALNKGLLEKEIMNTISEHPYDDALNNEFAESTLTNLISLEAHYAKKQVKNDEPIISPLDVFKSV